MNTDGLKEGEEGKVMLKEKDLETKIDKISTNPIKKSSKNLWQIASG